MRLVTFFMLVVFLFSFMIGGCGQKPEKSTVVPEIATLSPKVTAVPQVAPIVLTREERWNTILNAARLEKEVMVYSGAGPQVKDVIMKVMRSKYGIEAQIITATFSELANKIIAESRAGISLVDGIIVGGGTMVDTLRPTDVLASLEPFLVLPELKDPKAWPDGRFPFYDKRQVSVPLTRAYWSYILVNSDLVPEGAIKSYQDLIEPRWKGKIVMYDPIIGGPGKTMSAYFLAYIFGYDKGERFLQELVRQEPVLTKDARLLVEWVARGKYPIGLAASMSIVPQFR